MGKYLLTEYIMNAMLASTRHQLHHSVSQLLCQTGEVHTVQTLPLKSWLSSVWVGDAKYPVLALRQNELNVGSVFARSILSI